MLIGLLLWATGAYLAVPWMWARFYRSHPADESGPRITRTADGHPGDPINLAIEGSEEALLRAMHTIGWSPADPITLASSVRIVVDSVLDRPDDDAPVSHLFLFGRQQDLAFELPVGDGPRQRHHVRFWRSDRRPNGDPSSVPVWFGAATFDKGVGLSHTTGQVTHHIGPDMDAERNRIADALVEAHLADGIQWLDHYHVNRKGHNGGGDPWRTDGRLALILLEGLAPSH